MTIQPESSKSFQIAPGEHVINFCRTDTGKCGKNESIIWDGLFNTYTLWRGDDCTVANINRLVGKRFCGNNINDNRICFTFKDKDHVLVDHPRLGVAEYDWQLENNDNSLHISGYHEKLHVFDSLFFTMHWSSKKLGFGDNDDFPHGVEYAN